MLHYYTLPIIARDLDAQQSCSDPWVTDELVDGYELVAHVRVWVRHEFHGSCLSTQVPPSDRVRENEGKSDQERSR